MKRVTHDIDRMHVDSMTVFNVGSIRIQADLENACIHIKFLDAAGDKFTDLDILAYGLNLEPPGIELAEPVEPEASPEDIDHVASFSDGELA